MAKERGMSFRTIMEECRARYAGFHEAVKADRKPRSFAEAIEAKRAVGLNPVIAEIKPSSPTAGRLAEVKDPGSLAGALVAGGACGLSVLTEEKYFGGSLANLREVAAVASVPVLRKDFLFAQEQVGESYHYGADSVLLISSFFDVPTLERFLGEARRLRMEPLVEVHSREDIERSREAGAEIYVINNRDKDTLEVDLGRTRALAGEIGGVKISASGIETQEDLRYALRYCDAALVGSAIMGAPDPGAKVRELVHGG